MEKISLSELQQKLYVLTGQRQALTARRLQLVREMDEALARLSMQVEIQHVLEVARRKLHEASAGAFEAALTAILSDVIDNSGDVKFELDTLRGVPNLRVALHEDGVATDVLRNSGGSATNVLCAGIRYAAILRTQNRKIIVLDEPEAWVPADRVTRFYNVLQQLSEQAGVQTIIITHHGIDKLPQQFQVMRLSDETGQLTGEVLRHGPGFRDAAQPGLRSIRLQNFGSSVDFTIPLSSGVTAIAGDGNIGKSMATIGALNASLRGDSADGDVRRGCTEGSVTIQLENNLFLRWTRNTKSSPKIRYALLDAEGTEIRREDPIGRGEVPTWVAEVSGIHPQELDAHFWSQKTPVFLLNEPGSVQAKLLSVGQESSNLEALMKRYRELTTMDQGTVKRNKAAIATVDAQLESLAELDLMLADHQVLAQRRAALDVELQKGKALNEAISRIKKLTPAVSVYESLRHLVVTDVGGRLAVIESNLAKSTRARESSLRIARNQKVLNAIGSLPAPLKAFEALGDSKSVRSLLARLASAKGTLQVTTSLTAKPVTLPELAGTANVLQARNKIVKAQEAERDATAAVTPAKTAAAKAESDLEEFIQSLGGVCPLCHQHASASDFAGHHSHHG